MRTSVSLTILGAYNVLMSVLCLLMPDDMAVAGIGHAISTCGLLLLTIRKCALGTAKNALLAYSIGTALLLTLFACAFSESPAMDFSLEMAVPDVLAAGVSLFGYFKAK